MSTPVRRARQLRALAVDEAERMAARFTELAASLAAGDYPQALPLISSTSFCELVYACAELRTLRDHAPKEPQ